METIEEIEHGPDSIDAYNNHTNRQIIFMFDNFPDDIIGIINVNRKTSVYL